MGDYIVEYYKRIQEVLDGILGVSTIGHVPKH